MLLLCKVLGTVYGLGAVWLGWELARSVSAPRFDKVLGSALVFGGLFTLVVINLQ